MRHSHTGRQAQFQAKPPADDPGAPPKTAVSAHRLIRAEGCDAALAQFGISYRPAFRSHSAGLNRLGPLSQPGPSSPLNSCRVEVPVTRHLPQSGRIEARTGLRMMPTSPRSPLSFRTAGFPQYGWKDGVSDGAFPTRRSVQACSRHTLTTYWFASVLRASHRIHECPAFSRQEFSFLARPTTDPTSRWWICARRRSIGSATRGFAPLRQSTRSTSSSSPLDSTR